MELNHKQLVEQLGKPPLRMVIDSLPLLTCKGNWDRNCVWIDGLSNGINRCPPVFDVAVYSTSPVFAPATYFAAETPTEALATSPTS